MLSVGAGPADCRARPSATVVSDSRNQAHGGLRLPDAISGAGGRLQSASLGQRHPGQLDPGVDELAVIGWCPRPSCGTRKGGRDLAVILSARDRAGSAVPAGSARRARTGVAGRSAVTGTRRRVPGRPVCPGSGARLSDAMGLTQNLPGVHGTRAAGVPPRHGSVRAARTARCSARGVAPR